jgi:hypothetical protein
MNPEQLAEKIRSFYETFARVDPTTLNPEDLKECTWATDEIRKMRTLIETADSLSV